MKGRGSHSVNQDLPPGASSHYVLARSRSLLPFGYDCSKVLSDLAIPIAARSRVFQAFLTPLPHDCSKELSDLAKPIKAFALSTQNTKPKKTIVGISYLVLSLRVMLRRSILGVSLVKILGNINIFLFAR